MNIISHIQYNSFLILSYFFISFIVLILSYITKKKSNVLLFSTYRSSILNPLTYIRLVTHIFGHDSWSHFSNNFLYILLIGPMIEEKYGSINLLLMFMITSLVIALFNIIFNNYSIKGASGNVYMLIVLSSFSNITEGKIPITLILIFLFFITSEIRKSITDKNKSIYHDGHLIGALCGVIFGLIFLYYPKGILELIKSLL